ncbi:MAG TPA: ABC transporter permease, partial [Candidatus Dormibacteraeota bacterium]|nr:ABC transporter permease [Candidatus Dormibacteraeota bacterium]
ENLLLLIPAALVICLAGGAFGLLVLCFMSSQRAAQQVFPFLIFPQFFLAGVFAPIKGLDHNLLLNVLSHLAPMRYSVDLGRDVIYFHQPDPIGAVLDPTLLNLVVIAATSLIFMVVGTTIFVRNEKNR